MHSIGLSLNDKGRPVPHCNREPDAASVADLLKPLESSFGLR